MTTLPDHLIRLGEDLDDAWSRRDERRAGRPWHRHRVLVVAAVVVGVVAAGSAIASTVLKTAADEERGLLAGHVLFEGSEPRCTRLAPETFRCTLAEPPTGMAFYAPAAPGSKRKPALEEQDRVYDRFAGVKVQTVDETGRIDGGCEAQTADGRLWTCYLGRRAVEAGIIGADLLGARQDGPASG